MDFLIDAYILGNSFLIVIGLAFLAVVIWILSGEISTNRESRNFDKLMKNPKFEKKQKTLFLQYNSYTGTIKLCCYLFFEVDKGIPQSSEWEIDKEFLTIKREFNNDKVIPLYSINQVEVNSIKHSVFKGDHGYIHLWRVKPPWFARGWGFTYRKVFSKKRIDTMKIKPFQMEAALEIKRRHEEYIANQSKQNQS